MNRAKPSKRKSSRSREPAASRLEQAAGGERRAFLPAALCDALARRLAGGACNPRRSTPMNRAKPSKRKKQPVKRTGCKQAGTSGGRGAQGVPSRRFVRCVGAAVSGRSMQPKARRAHEQRKTKQTQKQPVKRTGCKQAGTNGGRGSEGRSFPPVLCDAVARRLAGGAYKPKCSAPMNRAKPNKRKSSRSREPAASRLEQAAGGERRAFLPAALCNALAQRLAGGACNPRRSAPMNRRKSSKRKSSGLGEPAANRLEEAAGGERKAFLPAGFDAMR